jgi:phage gp36-like protein
MRCGIVAAMSSLILKDAATSLTVPVLAAGPVASLQSAQVAPEGLVPGGTALSHLIDIAAQGAATITLMGGMDGERYRIDLRLVLVDGAVVDRSLDVAVLRSDWVMFDGTTGWLSLIAFAERFGLDELIAASDAGASGIIDRDYVVARLADAQAEVEANIAGRYAMPLAGNPPVIPPMLQAAVADLARLRLYRRAVPEEVAEAAKTARRNLERIARGDLRLNLPSGAALPEAAAETEMRGYSNSARLYPDNLADY